MKINIAAALFVMSLSAPFGLVRGESADAAATPASNLIADFASAVGSDGQVKSVTTNGQGILFQGLARDPSAVLAALSESQLINNPQLTSTSNDPKLELQPFVLIATLNPPPVTRESASSNLQNTRDTLVGQSRHALDSRMDAACDLISERQVGEHAEKHNMAMRWRCAGTLPQMISALRDLESGSPSLTLSDYAVYVHTPAKLATAADSYVEVRLTASATASLAASR